MNRFLNWGVVWCALLIAGAVFFIYAPSLRGTWIGDDLWYLPTNPLMSDPARIWKAWFAPGSWVEFYPIEETVQWCQWQLWHGDTLGYHLTNVFLHALSALLVWHLFRKLGVRWAWVGGLLFAVHPETVDSVASIVELKNTLSLPPFLWAMCLYIDYEETGSRRCYLWAVTFFLIAMLCKITMAPFPLVIPLYAWWKRGRIGWRDVLASVPFLVISLALGLTTVKAGNIYSHPIANWSPEVHALGGPLFRLTLAGQILAAYFSRCFLPLDPMPIYPLWPVQALGWLGWASWVMLALVLIGLWRKGAAWGRHALLGLGFFGICLFPFLGLNTISYMNATWILDHILYIPILGLIGLVAAAAGDLDARIPVRFRVWERGGLVVVLVLLTWQSRVYASCFANEETLARYNLQFDPGNEGLHNDLGVALVQRHAFGEAAEQFREALRLDPHMATASSNLGNALLARQDVPAAIEAYRQGVADAPDYGPLRRELAEALMRAGRIPEAVEQYRQALRLGYKPAEMHDALGTAYFAEHRVDAGIGEFEAGTALEPKSAVAQYNLAKALCLAGRLPEGADRYREAVRLDPGYAEAHNNLGIVLFRLGRGPEALAEFQAALKARPDFAEAANNLRLAQEKLGR